MIEPIIGAVYSSKGDSKIEVQVIEINRRVIYKFLNTGLINYLSVAGFNICYQFKTV